MALEIEFAFVEYTEILSWRLYSAARHTLCIFSAGRIYLNLDFDLSTHLMQQLQFLQFPLML